MTSRSEGSQPTASRWSQAAQVLANLAPGLVAAALGVTCGFAASAVVPAASALVVAMVVGLVAANAGLLGPSTAPGIALARGPLLRVGIVLLGLRLGLGDVVDLGGPPGMLLVVGITAATFLGTRFLAARFGLSPGLGLLLGTGYAICGASAIAAMQPLAETDEDETALAVGLVTLFGTAAVFTLPMVGHLLGLTPVEAGYWAGASVHDVAQVVATAGSSGPAALEAAVVVKLSRVVLLAPLLVLVSLARRRRLNHIGAVELARLPLLPGFVVLFLSAVAVRTSGVLSDPLLDAAAHADAVFLAAAMFGLGASVRLNRLRRLGVRPFAVGTLAWLLVAGAALPVALTVAG